MHTIWRLAIGPKVAMEAPEVYRLLVRRLRHGLIICRTLFVISAASAAAACFVPGGPPWAVAAFLAGIMLHLVSDHIRRRNAGAWTVSVLPEIVYWAHPTCATQPVSGEPVEDCRFLLLHLRDGTQFEVHLLPSEMRSFVSWLSERNPSVRWGEYDAVAPDVFRAHHGAGYTCLMDAKARNRSGKVFDEHGVLRWQYRFRTNAEGRTRRNPLNKPDFIFADTNGRGEVVIRRTSLIPSCFDVLEGNDVIGRIAQRGLLGLKYVIRITGFHDWTFRISLCSLRFFGHSRSGTDICVVVGPSKMQWNILLRPGGATREFLAALAFIHSQWCTHGWGSHPFEARNDCRER